VQDNFGTESAELLRRVGSTELLRGDRTCRITEGGQGLQNY